MANFLQSAIGNYQRGWQQRYGGGRRPGPMADPVANNPAIGAPIGAKDEKDFNPHPGWDPKDPTRPPYTIPFYPQGPIWKEGPPPTYPQPQPTPRIPSLPSQVADNPAVGGPVGSDQHKVKAQPKGKYPTVADDPGAREANALWNTNEARWLQWQLQAKSRINELADSPDYNTRMNATQANYAMGRLEDDLDNLKKTRQKNPFDPEQTASLDAARKDINDSIGLIHEPFFPMPVTKSSPSDITQAPQAQPSPSPSSTPLQPKPGNTLMRPELSGNPTPVAQNPAMGQPLGADDGQSYAQPQQPSNTNLTPQDQFLMLMPWLTAAFSGARGGTPVNSNPAMGAPLGAPAPIASNPEVGQFSSGGGGMNPLVQWYLQNYLFGGGGGGGGTSLFGFGGGSQSPPNALAGNPTASQVGPPGPGQGQDWGINPSASSTDIANAAATSPSADAISGSQASQSAAASGGMGGGGPGMGGMIGGGLLSGLGNIVSSFSKQPTFTYSQDNVALPQRAYFVPPNLSPNQNAGF